MNNPNHNKEYDDLRNVRLTAREKSEMHARLLERINKETSPTRSPYFVFIRYSKHHALGAFALLLLFALPTTYAAEQSLPGNPLYYLKTEVMEPIEENLARTPQNRARVIIENAEERLEDTSRLLEEEKSTPEEVATAGRNLSRKIEKLAHEVADLDMTTETEAKIEIQKELLTIVEAYVSLLEGDSEATSYATTSREIDADANELGREFNDSLKTFWNTADDEDVAAEVVEKLLKMESRLTEALPEEDGGDGDTLNPREKFLIDGALAEAHEELARSDVDAALETLTLSDHALDVMEKVEEVRTKAKEGKSNEDNDSDEFPLDDGRDDEGQDSATTTPDSDEVSIADDTEGSDEPPLPSLNETDDELPNGREGLL